MLSQRGSSWQHESLICSQFPKKDGFPMNTELDLSAVLRNAPRDCWLALTQDQSKVVGRGENMREALDEAKKNGVEDPVLIWAPKVWHPVVF